MGLNDTPSGERVHIAFFGCRNAGKSSLVNAFTGQSLSIVSETKGTTTDPVNKSMELLPLGPVVIIDTPGIDDEGELGKLRIERTQKVLQKTDIAILVVDATCGLGKSDEELIALFKDKGMPYIVAYNKSDLLSFDEANIQNNSVGQNQSVSKGNSNIQIQGFLIENLSSQNKNASVEDSRNQKQSTPAKNEIYVSALMGTNIQELKKLTTRIVKELPEENELIGDLVSEGDKIVLVIPIDKAAPKGRLILPQQQVIRNALNHGAIPVMCRDSELTETLDSLKEPPRMVITDSQAFGKVSKFVPESIPLTSFSILMARYKGNLYPSVEGAAKIGALKEGDKVLVSEGCTHHRQCGDIGSVKLPAWIREFTGISPEITLSSGTEFPTDLSPYKLIIHCGACMLNPAEAQSRYRLAQEQNVPITNYGTAIAYMKGILKRSLQLFPDTLALIG